jgi:hypothetical protein
MRDSSPSRLANELIPDACPQPVAAGSGRLWPRDVADSFQGGAVTLDGLRDVTEPFQGETEVVVRVGELVVQFTRVPHVRRGVVVSWQLVRSSFSAPLE